MTKKHFDGDLSKSLLIAFEKGYKALNGIHAQDVSDWKTFSDLVNQLVEHYEDISYRWIALDTLDYMYQYCAEYIVKRERLARKDAKIKSISDIPWGGGYAMVDEEITRVMNKLIGGGFGVFMITHDTDKKFESRSGESYDKTTLSLPKRARDTFVNMSDFIIFVEIQKEKEGDNLVDNRYIYLRSDSDIEAGSRFENVPERIPYDEGELLEVFETAVLGSFDEDEKAVEEAKETQAEEREEKAKEASEETKKEATVKEMVDEIAGLIGQMNKEQQTKLKSELKENFGKTNYKTYKKDDLVKALEIVSNI